MLVDDYVVNISRDGSRKYFKNGLLHRENGPAITNPIDKDKYFKLSDESLYQKQLSLHSVEPYYHVEDDLWEYPVYLFVATSYYLNGIQYSKEEFTTRKLKKELAIELAQTQGTTQIKKTKV